MSDAAPIIVRSAIPGRIRWEVEPLLGNERLAEELTRKLIDDARLTEVVANAATGRLLVLYDPALESTNIRQDIADRLSAILRTSAAAASGFRAARRAREKGEDRAHSASLRWAEAKTILIGAPIAAIAFSTASPILVITTIGAMAASASFFFRKLKERDPAAVIETNGTMEHIVNEFKHYSGPLILSSACTVAAVAFSLSRFTLIGHAIDTVIPTDRHQTAEELIRKNGGKIVGVGALMLGATLVDGALQWAGVRLWRSVALAMEHRLRLLVYATIQRAEMGYIESMNANELQMLVTQDVRQIGEMLSVASDILDIAATISITALSFLFISPQVAWFAMLGMPLTLLAIAWVQGKLMPRSRALGKETIRLNASVTTAPDALATVKAFGAEHRQLENIQNRSLVYQKTSEDLNRVAAGVRPVVESSVMAGIAATVVAGGLASASLVTVGEYSMMIMMSRQLLVPLTQLGKLLERGQRSYITMQRLFKVIDEMPIESRGTLPLPLKKVKGNIQFRDIRFSYDNGHEVLRGISLNIKPGKTTAIVGPTGSGKSTLLRLLVAFRRPKSGEIFVDKQPVAELRIDDLRRAFAFVSQEVYLFAGTIRDNINFASPNATHEETQRAARIAAADKFIEALPNGYDTVVGERGVRLSGGERQRIAIARAILSDAPILIFDEATSQVDNETEHRIYTAINAELKKKTKIIVAHRLAAARMADMIYVIDDGKVAEQGPHDKIVEQGGLYATLWRLQIQDQDDEMAS